MDLIYFCLCYQEAIEICIIGVLIELFAPQITDAKKLSKSEMTLIM